MNSDDPQGEAYLVVVAQQVWDGSRGPGDFMEVFAGATVYAERTQPPAVLVTDLGERGRWMVVFSTLERLAAHSGECAYFATTGADLLELVPPGVGVMVDPDDEHRFPVLSRMAPPEVVARAWAQAGGRRADTA
ncbi:SseB family protein [Amycolatopsis rifamycinica]|uniref:SseB family protein n=1 Tax=Amycolatopsis rifamycinica TaxID=287986 RepID=UPI00068DB0E8|nr:SseB family protein [Amycolatopsis rifamycinica]